MSNPDDSIRLLTEEDVANILRLSTRTIRKFRNAGEIGFVRLGPRLIRYTEKDVAGFIDAHRVTDVPRQPTRNVRGRGRGSSFMDRK